MTEIDIYIYIHSTKILVYCMTNSSTLPVPRSERLIGLVLCDTFQRFDLLKPAFEKSHGTKRDRYDHQQYDRWQ